MKKITYIFSLAIAGSAMVAVTSCDKADPNSPGIEFMPDMYRSPSLETNMKQEYMGDSMMTNRMPVAGTIARGYMPEMYTPADSNGYEMAGLNVKNPLPLNDNTLAEGKELYTKFCVHCHGPSGQGDGAVGLKLPGQPPSYTSPPLMALSEGKMYFSVTFGKGMMGPHGPLLNQEERWKVIHYIRKELQKTSAPTQESAQDSTKRENAAGTTDSQPKGNTNNEPKTNK
jgi:mono/diheme cytochrome c family protein